MIDRYKNNQEKYNQIRDYIESHPNIEAELRTEILNIIGRYKTLIFCLDKQEVCDIVDKCATAGDKQILQREFSNMISGKVVDHDVSVYEAEREYSGKYRDEEYNLD